MRIVDRLRTGPPCFSFEFFPPKSEEGVAQLFTTLKELADLQPGFVSVTYGAGGSTRQLTLELTSAIRRETGIEAMAHLTCVGHGRAELAEILQRLEAAGIENVLALRGDPPQGQASFDSRARRLLAWQRAHAIHPRARTSLLPRRRVLSRGAPRVRWPRRGDRAHQAQGRRRCRVPDHAALLRQRVLLPLRRARPQGWHHLPDRTGPHADHQHRADRAHHAHVRRDGADAPAGWRSRSARTIRRQCCSSASRTRRCRRPTCWRTARPACTSTRSTARARRA